MSAHPKCVVARTVDVRFMQPKHEQSSFDFIRCGFEFIEYNADLLYLGDEPVFRPPR